MKTQIERISEYMDWFGHITPLEAMKDLGCMRLAARICDMKRMGYKIKSERVKDKNRFGETISYMKYSKDPKGWRELV